MIPIQSIYNYLTGANGCFFTQSRLSIRSTENSCSVLAKPKVAEVLVLPRLDGLLDELLSLIDQNLDMPSRYALAWTCKRFYQLKKNEDFHPYAFADQCAKLGYRKLLAYSVTNHGPFDKLTACLAARHGHSEMLEDYLQRRGYDKLVLEASEQTEITDERLQWAYAAAHTGIQSLLGWLKVDAWARPSHWFVLATKAAEGGHIALMQQFLGKTPQNLRFGFSDSILSSCISSDQVQAAWEALKFARQTAVADDEYIDDAELHSRIFSLGGPSGSHRLIAWSLATVSGLTSRQDLMHNLMETGCRRGFLTIIELVKDLVPFNASYIQAIVQEPSMQPTSKHFDCLKLVHATFALTDSPLQEDVVLPIWATRESAEWMVKMGYRFNTQSMMREYLEKFAYSWNDEKNELRAVQIDLELIAWMLQRGAPVTSTVIGVAACTCNTKLLEMLWKGYRSPDTEIDPLEYFLIWKEAKWMNERPRGITRLYFSPIQKTLTWLLAHGFTFSSASVERCKRLANAIAADSSRSDCPSSLKKLGQLIKHFSETKV